jgi:hypothetical protein
MTNRLFPLSISGKLLSHLEGQGLVGKLHSSTIMGFSCSVHVASRVGHGKTWHKIGVKCCFKRKKCQKRFTDKSSVLIIQETLSGVRWRTSWKHWFTLILHTYMLIYLCGLVVRVYGYRSRGPGFDSRRFQIFWEAVGLERGLLSLVRTTEELLGRNSSGSGQENRDPLRWPRNTLYPQKLALLCQQAAVARSA